MLRIVLSVLFLVSSATAWSQSAPPSLAPQNVARTNTKAPTLKAIEKKNTGPASVRIGLRLTNFQKLVTTKEGKHHARFQPLKELNHTLRARLGRKNHFYIDQYHIESKPMLWKKETMEYALRLNIYRRYGAFGQLEESMGYMDVSGILSDRQDNIFVLYGSAQKRFRDKFGNPVLDLVAGYKKGAEPAQAKADPKQPAVRRAPRKAESMPSPEKVQRRF